MSDQNHGLREHQHAETRHQHGNAGSERRTNLVTAHIHQLGYQQTGKNTNALEYEQVHAGRGGVEASGCGNARYPIGHGVESG